MRGLTISIRTGKMSLILQVISAVSCICSFMISRVPGCLPFFWVFGKQIRSLAFNLRNISLQEISFELPLWSHQFQMRQSSLESLVRPQVGLLAINSLISAISTSVMVGLENICLFIRV